MRKITKAEVLAAKSLESSANSVTAAQIALGRAYLTNLEDIPKCRKKLDAAKQALESVEAIFMARMELDVSANNRK
jgi:hypothetical protein